MKIKLILLMIFLTGSFMAQNQINFDDYFSDSTMRIDYHHIGDSEMELITIDKIYQYGTWAGSLKNLLDQFNNGKYYVKIYDAESGKLIYSKGFDSYFGEYKSSAEAAEGIKKAFQETALIPYPKKEIKFSIERRKKDKTMEEFFSTVIDPSDIMIVREEIKDSQVKIVESEINGDPHNKVDVVFVGEGYTKNEEEKFRSDLNKFTEIFFKPEPYKSNREKFNVYGVYKPSEETGVDEPRADIYKNTVLDATFNSMGSERYLLTENNKTLHDLAGHVPYDAIFVMTNHSRYGGGGIYNFFCTFTTDNQWQDYLLIHEFGHSFAGLADEYYTSEVSYNDFYPPGVEPVEPNITALLDKDNLKWKELKTPGVEIPTPWLKKRFDESDLSWQKTRREMNDNVAELKRKNASGEEIKKAEEDYANADKTHAEKIDEFFEESEFKGVVGAFEGAGYASEGLYRPMLDCIMFTKGGDKPFCKVCQKAIERVINHYAD